MYTKLTILILICCCHCYIYADNGGDINAILKTRIAKYESATNDVEKFTALSKIIVDASRSNLDLSYAYLRVYEDLLKENKSNYGLVRYYNVKGILSDVEDLPQDSVLHWYNLSQDGLEKFNIQDIALSVTLHNNKAISYSMADKKGAAIGEYMAGLEVIKDKGSAYDSERILLLANLSGMFLRAKRYEEALDNIIRAENLNLAIEKRDNKRTNIYEYITTLKGEIYYELERYEESEKTFEGVLNNENKLTVQNVYCRTLLGKVYISNNKFELARKTIRQALQDSKKLNITIENTVYALLTMAELELKEDNPTSSLELMDDIFRLYDSKGKKPDDPDIYHTMSKALERSGRFEESLQYNREYQKLVDKENDHETSTKYGELESKIQAIEREYELNEFQITQKLQESRMSILIVAFLLSVLLMIFIFQMYKKKEEHNQALILLNVEATLAKDKAVAAAKVKENFLSTMSHEMRTPLNAVIGITNILLDESPHPKQIDHLNNLKFSGEGLLNIINEVLDFSKIEAKKLEIKRSPFQLQVFMDKMTNSIRHGNKNPKVKIFQDQQLGDLNHLVLGDDKRLGQILTNLLGNAIKFTDQGHIVLRSRLVNNNKERVSIKFLVEDSGIGIPTDKLDVIFESFSQVNNDINRVHQGTGLGLAITKRLVELQGGTIEVVSKVDRGSTFSFTLEFEKSSRIPTKAIAQPSSKIYQEGIEGKKILLVEDNKLNQLVALKVLKKFKVEAALAENGQEALEMVQSGDFDLVLMDIHMPIMDGIEATYAIRALENPLCNQIPIIALSADAYSDKVKIATESGMNDYLAKPFKPEILFQKIQSNLRQSEGSTR